MLLSLPALLNRHLNASSPDDASHDKLVGMPACRYRDTITSELSRICKLPTSPVWRQAKDMLKEEGIETESDTQQAAAPATASADVQVRWTKLRSIAIPGFESLRESPHWLLCCAVLVQTAAGLQAGLLQFALCTDTSGPEAGRVRVG